MERISSKQRLMATEVRLRELLVSACNGHEASYLLFLKEIAAYLRGYFRKRLPRDVEDVEDLVQETLLALHNSRHTYDAGQPATAWVYAIARYKMADWFRGRSAHENLTIPFDEEDAAFAESDTEAAEARIDVEEMLATLPEHFRIPIFHVKLHGLSVAATSKLTGMSESAVKIGIHRGLKLLAKRVRGGS